LGDTWTYHLYALIEHISLRANCGHYVAYKRLFPECGTSNKWVRANDSSIDIVSQKHVLSRQEGAYMLFY